MANDEPKLSEVLRLIDRVRREHVTAHILSGIFTFLSLLLALTFIFLSIEMFLAPSEGVRWGMLATTALLVIGGGILLILKRILHSPDDETIALLIESKHVDLHNELINAVRFSEDPEQSALTFVKAAIRESGQRAKDISPRGVVRWTPAKRGIISTVLLVGVWGLLIGITPSRVANALTRVMMPSANIEKVGAVQIASVSPGDITIISGDDLQIQATFEGELDPDTPPVIEHWVDGGAVREEPLVQVNGGPFGCDLQQIKTPRTYRVSIGASRSREFQIAITERPLVTKVSAVIQYPAYTGSDRELIDDTGGQVNVIKGSRVLLKFFSSKRLKAAHILTPGQEEPQRLRVMPDGSAAVMTTELTIDRAMRLQVEIEDTHNCRNSRTIHIAAIKDRAPQVKIIKPGRAMTIELGQSLYIAFRGTDDYGIVSAELVQIKAVSDSDPIHTVIKSWDRFANPLEAEGNYTWKFGVKEGYKKNETIRYFVTMKDANNVDGPGIGRSSEFTVRLENKEERKQERDKKYSNWQEELRKILEEQQRLRDKAHGIAPEDGAK
jgi:Domain of unknown function (DUF4175)